MPRAILVKDRKVMIAPGSRKVIVFDTATGAGAECCCGGAGGGACCNQTSSILCTTTAPPVAPYPIVCVCGKRMEFYVQAVWKNNQDKTGFDDHFLNLDFHSKETLTRNMGAFWESTKPDSNDLNDCGDTVGAFGAYVTRYDLVQNGTGVGVHPVNYTWTDPTPHNPFPTRVAPGWAWNSLSDSGGLGSVPDILMNTVAIIDANGNSATVNAYNTMQGRHLEVASLAGTTARYPWKVCSAGDTYNASSANDGWTISETFNWTGQASCTGGSCQMDWNRTRTQRPANNSGPGNYDIVESMSLTVSWTMTITQCPSGSGSGSTPAFSPMDFLR